MFNCQEGLAVTNHVSLQLMSHIVCIWELGDDLGHLHRLAALASELVTRGHKVSLLLKDLSRAELFFKDSPVNVYQAPVWGPRPNAPRLTKTIADILAYKGYGDIEGLMSLVKAWRALLNLLQPEVLVFDFAPTAMLAASAYSIPKFVFSSGFSSPAPGVPGADLCPWVPVKAQAVAEAEQFIVKNINAVAQRQGLASVNYVGDLFQSDQTFVADIPLFDLYGAERRHAVYTGPLRISAGFETCDWGDAKCRKLFVYLKPGRQHVEIALHALANAEANVRVFCPGSLPPKITNRQSSRFMISAKPFDLAHIMSTADAVVSHGGVGLASLALLSGVPVLALPTQLEQKINSMQIHQAQLGTWVAQERRKPDAEKIVSEFVDNASYDLSVARFAEKYASLKTMEAITLVADACERPLQTSA